MTQKEKLLLLKDLSARLPYGVKVKTPYNDAELIGIVKRKGFKKDVDYIDAVTNKETYPIQYVQPYLRPMSSMTEEEKEEYHKLCDSYYDIYFDSINSIDWLNAHHFDYRGLIPKNLAIEVTKENNPYKLDCL